MTGDGLPRVLAAPGSCGHPGLLGCRAGCGLHRAKSGVQKSEVSAANLACLIRLQGAGCPSGSFCLPTAPREGRKGPQKGCEWPSLCPGKLRPRPPPRLPGLGPHRTPRPARHTLQQTLETQDAKAREAEPAQSGGGAWGPGQGHRSGLRRPRRPCSPAFRSLSAPSLPSSRRLDLRWGRWPPSLGAATMESGGS